MEKRPCLVLTSQTLSRHPFILTARGGRASQTGSPKYVTIDIYNLVSLLLLTMNVLLLKQKRQPLGSSVAIMGFLNVSTSDGIWESHFGIVQHSVFDLDA